jgi:FkbM family methyltransferase
MKFLKQIKESFIAVINEIFIFLLLKKQPIFKKISGVIHVGANEGQEREKYKRYSLSVIWIEPIPEVFERLKSNIKDYPDQKAFKYLLTDEDNREIEFKISNNNGESSSILDIGLHANIWPEIHYIKSIKLRSLTLASLIKNEKIDIQKYQALIIDTQGTELLVLKGASEILKKFKYIIVEAADFESYVGCCTIKDLSCYLNNFGFKLINRARFAYHRKVGNYYNVVYEKQ